METRETKKCLKKAPEQNVKNKLNPPIAHPKKRNSSRKRETFPSIRKTKHLKFNSSPLKRKGYHLSTILFQVVVEPTNLKKYGQVKLDHEIPKDPG